MILTPFQIAPDRLDTVLFHVAANAADGNESADGDFIHLTSAESSGMK